MKEINNNFDNIFPKENVIVMLHAHSDDESFLSAGIINEFIVRNYKILIIYLATGLIENQENTFLRRKELSEALKILGLPNVKFLKYCEPKYKENNMSLYMQSTQKVSDEIALLIEKEGIKKYLLFSYDKNGGYGNKDHLVVHKVGKHLFASSSAVNSLFEVTILRNIYKDWISKKIGQVSESYLPKISYWSAEFGLRNDEIDCVYTLTSEQLLLKKEALSKHVSQIKKDEFPLSLTGADFIELFGKEYFTCVDRSIL